MPDERPISIRRFLLWPWNLAQRKSINTPKLEEARLSSPNRINEGIDSRIMAASYDIQLLLATYWPLGGMAGLPLIGFPGGMGGGTLEVVITARIDHE